MESEEAHARVDGEWDESEAERLDIDASDAETSFKVAHKRSLGAAQMEFGLDYRTKKREIDHTYYERSEEHTSELQSLMRISYAVFCLKKKKKKVMTVHTKTTTISKT